MTGFTGAMCMLAVCAIIASSYALIDKTESLLTKILISICAVNVALLIGYHIT